MKPRAPANKSAPSPPEFVSAAVARARRFYPDLNPAHEKRLVVVCGGLEHCTPGYVIHRATFPFHFSQVFKGILGLSPDAFRRMR